MEWMKNLPLYYEDEHFIYVHAGIDKNKMSMKSQSAMDLLWIRERFYNNTHKYGKTVIFGHTPTMFFDNRDGDSPVWINGNIAIDTGCVFGGALTALIIEDGKVIEYCQVKKGETNMTEKKVKKANDNKLIMVETQKFYGNRVITEINPKHFDHLMLGITDYNEPIREQINRTIIRLPEDDELVVIYNQNREDKILNNMEKYSNIPTCVIKSKGIKLYSRCIACRIDFEGKLRSIEPEDVEIINKYFTE